MFKEWSPSSWRDFIDGMICGDLFQRPKMDVGVLMPFDLCEEEVERNGSNGSPPLNVE